MALHHIFSDGNYHIQEPYDYGFPSNNNVTLGARKMSFAESIFGKDCLASGSRRLQLLCPEQKPVLLMTHPISELNPRGQSVLKFSMRARSSAKARLQAPKHFKFFKCEVDISCFSNSMPFIFRRIRAPDFQRRVRHQRQRNDSKGSKAALTRNNICTRDPTKEHI